MELTGIKFLRRWRINAIVLYPLVLFADKKPSGIIRKHEEIHLQQIRRDGPFTFYFKYVQSYLSGRVNGLNHDEAYRAIPYEQEAYAYQGQLTYQIAKKDTNKV